MADEIEVVTPAAAPTPEPEKVLSPREVKEQRFDAFVESQKSEGVAQEAPAAPATPTDAKASEAAAEGAQPAEKAAVEVAAPTAKTPYTKEEFAAFEGNYHDRNFDWDRWPTELQDAKVFAKKVASGYGTRHAQLQTERAALEAERAKPATESRHDETPADEEFSSEYLEAVELSQSLDVKEAAKGRRLLAKFDAQVIAKEIGIDPAQNKAQALAQSAYASALAQVPEIATYDMKELHQIVVNDPALLYLVEKVGTEDAIATAMVSSAKILKAQKASATVAATAAAAQAAADQKKNATLKVIQSNARPQSADLVNGKGAPPAKLTAWEKKSQRFDQEVARQGGNRT